MNGVRVLSVFSLAVLPLISACGGAQPSSAKTGANVDGPGAGADTSPSAAGIAVTFAPQVIVGSNFGCWLKADKSVKCWGALADDAPSGSFVQVAAASFHACGTTTGGDAKCWGAHSAAPPGKFAQVAAGDHASCGVRPDGELVCWGTQGKTEYPAALLEKCGSTEEHKECEDFSWLGMRLVTKRPQGKFRRVAVGGRHACALTAAGEAKCWAPAEDDQDEAGAREVDDISLPPGKYSQIAAGFLHTCAVEGDAGGAGRVVCAGGVEGQSEPGAAAASTVQVAAGVLSSCALLADQSVACWGSDEHGATRAASGKFISVATGLHLGCALPAEGSPVCWGDRESSAAAPSN
jgi:alpha-tubulin suppressor-like RCC1 family protein